AFAPHGTHFVVAFVLRDRAGHAVDAANVVVKVVCPTRDAWSLARATGSHPGGRYRIVATAPPGGLGTIVIRVGVNRVPVPNRGRLHARRLGLACFHGAAAGPPGPAARDAARLDHRPLQLPLRLLHAEGGLRARLRVPRAARAALARGDRPPRGRL